jgi:hypothetical protein
MKEPEDPHFGLTDTEWNEFVVLMKSPTGVVLSNLLLEGDKEKLKQAIKALPEQFQKALLSMLDYVTKEMNDVRSN